MSALPPLAGLAILAAVWAGPLPALATQSFVAHMAIHLGVVALAAPLLATAVARALDARGARAPSALLPLFAALAEAAVIWAWHMPALHEAARLGPLPFLVEQASYLAVGLLLWLAVLRAAPGAGAAALLMTAMHMAMLGALLALAPRPLYGDGCGGAFGLSALQDQQWAGVLMLAVGGSSYLAGALPLLARLLSPPTAQSVA